MAVRLGFQETIYQTPRQLLSAIAYAWATGCGHDSGETVAAYIAAGTDLEHAEEAIRGWGLDQVGDEELWRGEPSPSHMQLNGYTAEDLAAAFGRFREHLANVAFEGE